MSAPTPRLSLEQFAGISAALAEKLPLAQILEQEQVDEADYREGEMYWRKEIADAVPTQLEYTAKLRIAEDCLGRKLNPISDDPGAWVGLLAALATTSDQAELLSKLGISMNDIGRLGRAWKERAKKEPEVGQRLAELAKNPTPPEKVTAGPIELRPFPWTPPPKPKPAVPEPAMVPAVSMPAQDDPNVKRQLASFQVVAKRPEQPAASPWAQEPGAAPPSASDPIGSLGGWSIDHYVHLVYELRANPTQAETTLVRAGLVTTEHRRELHAYFHRRFEAEPGLRVQYEEKLAARSQPQSSPAAPKPVPLASTSATEEVDVSMLRRRAIPFAGAQEARVDPSRKREQTEADERLAKHKPDDAAVLARMKAAFQKAPSSDPKGTAETAYSEEGALQPALPFAASPESTPAPSRMAGTAAIEDDAPQPLGWSFERYCRFCIDLQLQGLPEEAALAAEKISRRERQLLDAYWQPRLASDQTLRLTWLRLSNQRAAELRRR
ncbi:MAG: hypothetical protein U0271_11835 [Polyangiaceae bacterium]